MCVVEYAIQYGGDGSEGWEAVNAVYRFPERCQLPYASGGVNLLVVEATR
jgi:hypothetical protein